MQPFPQNEHRPLQTFPMTMVGLALAAQPSPEFN